MSDVVVRTQILATATGSVGASNFIQDAYSPIFVETEGASREDPFFRVSPAIAVGDSYLSELSELPDIAPPKK